VSQRYRRRQVEPQDDLARWKLEVTSRPPVYPQTRAPISYQPYQSIFENLISRTADPERIHVEDYSWFLKTLTDAAFLRLRARLAIRERSQYDHPRFLTFPGPPSDVARRPKPPAVCWWDRLLGSEAARRQVQLRQSVERFNEWVQEFNAQRREDWRKRKQAFDESCAHRQAEFEAANGKWQDGISKDSRQLKDLLDGHATGSRDAVSAFVKASLDAVPLPAWCPHDYHVRFDASGQMLLIELRIPYLNGMPVVKSRNQKVVLATKTESADIRRRFSFLVPLRLVWETAHIDESNRIQIIACNVHVVFDDPATGRMRRDTVMSVVAGTQQIREINLDRVDPEACFRGLKGLAAADILELVPVQPLIHFDKNDSRFVEARPILDGMGAVNLATMEWQDFEHLVRELLEREFGADVRITQASRDRGVDAVAFDPDPIKGGKYVIQAKRYVNTVDVSSVRDLFGTLMNEGANRGILVTTSNYGRDAHEFAKDKPITLLNGANLLHLLEKHGYHCRIDLDD